MKMIIVDKRSGFDVPIGSIILWYGLADDIPDEYEIYEELKGYLPLGGLTTDLTPRGSNTHSHSYPSDALSLQPNHQHNTTGSLSGSASGAGPLGWYSSTDAVQVYHSHGVSSTPTGLAGSHRHTLGNTGSANNLNSHYSLYYIRRVA